MFASKDIFQTASSGPYTIARSVRLRSSASAYLTRTFASNGNRQKWTWSAWVKRGLMPNDTSQYSMLSSGGALGGDVIMFSDGNKFTVNIGLLGINAGVIPTQVQRDPSAWYHLFVAIDTAQATAANRVLMYVNGVQITSFSTTNYPAQNTNTTINSTTAQDIGRQTTYGNYFDGYLTEINFIDGQALTPSSFGETDSITGVWKPKAYSGTYGTNGFELNFSDNSNNTATTIGKDYSGNGNNWTPNNISVTAGATYDSMTDVPTLTSATAANYPVLNPLSPFHTYVNITNGNLTATGNGSGNTDTVCTTFGSPSTSIYWEYTCVTVYSGGNYGRTGVITTYPTATGQTPGEIASLGGFGWRADGYLSQNGSNTGGLVPSFTTGDVLGFALNIASGTCALYKNNSLQYTVTGLSTTATYFPATAEYNGSVGAFNFGQQGFKYTPPTGFVALNTYNLPASTIKNGAAYMAATTYTGTGATQSIVNTVNGTSCQPDMVWLKIRSSADSHNISDIVRGISGTGSPILFPNGTGAEATFTGFGVSALNSNGFTLIGNGGLSNTSGSTYVAWQWKAGGTSSSNTNGSITSTVSVGATQGFSVVTYTGNSTNNATVGHGLGVVPSMIILKNRSGAYDWPCYHISLGSGKYIYLNQSATAATDANMWKTTPTSTVFTLGTYTENNGSSNNYVAYCFSAVAGYSAFGSYIGNGTQGAGPFVFLGFRPRYVLIKNINGAYDWHCYDSSRSPYNYSGSNILKPNTADAELTGRNDVQIDLLSNGFRLIGNDIGINQNGSTHIYMAFAENPFKNALAR